MAPKDTKDSNHGKDNKDPEDSNHSRDPLKTKEKAASAASIKEPSRLDPGKPDF